MTRILNKKKNSSQTLTKLKLFIVMGVSGSGKTVVGKKLARDLNKQADFEFIDADNFHSPAAKQRMADNLPLDDAMRAPWIAAIMNKLVELNEHSKNVVLAYSGLKHQHRQCFRTLNFHCHYYYLSAEIGVIRSRMLNRKNHFFKPDLLVSQFSAMEEINDNEHDVKKFDVSGTLDEVYNEVFTHAKQNLKKEST